MRCKLNAAVTKVCRLLDEHKERTSDAPEDARAFGVAGVAQGHG